MSEENINQPVEENASEQEVNKISVERSMELITGCHHEVTSCWNEYLREEYNGNYLENRDDMVDIITIVEFIVTRIKDSKPNGLKELFQAIEQVLDTGDGSSRELVVVGILEGLRNNCDIENIDYHNLFDNWFLQKTKKVWDGLIYFWESSDPVEIKQQNLLNFKI